MKDKFCFSKTLTYLVLLVAVVVGAFYTMNYVNQKKVTTNSEAASSFYTASQQCSSLATGSNEVAYCIPGGSFNSIDIALKFVELKTGIKFSSKVRITSTKCSYIDVFLEGRCVVFTRTGGTANPPVVQNPPVVNPPVGGGLPTANCSTYGYQEVPSAAKSRIKDYCKNLNEGRYEYGGGWGLNATCYSTIKTCTTSVNCEDTGCLRCLNERVEVINCINAKVAPTNTLSAQIKCPPDGKIKYGWGEGNKCYTLNGLPKTRESGEPYCTNAVVSDAFCCNAGLYKPVKCPLPLTPTNSLNKPKNCLPFKCRDISSSYLNLTYYYMNTRYYSNDKCGIDFDITSKGVGNYCKGL